jgi:hypothetical protein
MQSVHPSDKSLYRYIDKIDGQDILSLTINCFTEKAKAFERGRRKATDLPLKTAGLPK